MKEKIYSMHETAVDKDGLKHEVMIVGVCTQQKEWNRVYKDVQVPVNENKSVDVQLSFLKPSITRNLKYGFAICHSDDTFNEEVGKELALKRAKTSPMGELETKYITTLCPDQINLILYGELRHIINNIDKYIKKND
jgi:hypothetical protein